MNVWFTRSNGESDHNNPANARFVPGEPPTFPVVIFDYRLACLEHGFARIGWPGTGDLRDRGWVERGKIVYEADRFKPHFRRYLAAFAAIKTGDLVLIPAGGAKYEVHLGLVVQRRGLQGEPSSRGARIAAYYYHHDLRSGHCFENAHRVDVRWARDEAGVYAAHVVRELGGLWPRAFGPVKAGHQHALRLASDVGLLQVTSDDQ